MQQKINKQKLENQMKKLKEQFIKIDFICIGSITAIYNICGKKNCICKTDKSKQHGPYNLWTRKIKGKTISKHLSEKQVKACRKFIINHKKLKRVIEKMKDISVKILEIY